MEPSAAHGRRVIHLLSRHHGRRGFVMATSCCATRGGSGVRSVAAPYVTTGNLHAEDPGRRRAVTTATPSSGSTSFRQAMALSERELPDVGEQLGDDGPQSVGLPLPTRALPLIWPLTLGLALPTKKPAWQGQQLPGRHVQSPGGSGSRRRQLAEGRWMWPSGRPARSRTSGRSSLRRSTSAGQPLLERCRVSVVPASFEGGRLYPGREPAVHSGYPASLPLPCRRRGTSW